MGGVRIMIAGELLLFRARACPKVFRSRRKSRSNDSDNSHFDARQRELMYILRAKRMPRTYAKYERRISSQHDAKFFHILLIVTARRAEDVANFSGNNWYAGHMGEKWRIYEAVRSARYSRSSPA